MVEERVDPHDFLDFAHDIDHSTISLDAALGDAIAQLPGRKLILTNGSRRHAENVAKKLGILDHFEDVFDIASADFVPKPERVTYERFLSAHRVEPTRAALFEDIARNLVVPHDLGMATVLVVPKIVDPYREAFEQEAVGRCRISTTSPTTSRAFWPPASCRRPRTHRELRRPARAGSFSDRGAGPRGLRRPAGGIPGALC